MHLHAPTGESEKQIRVLASSTSTGTSFLLSTSFPLSLQSFWHFQHLSLGPFKISSLLSCLAAFCRELPREARHEPSKGGEL